MSGQITAGGGGGFNDAVAVTTSNEGFRYGKTGMPGSNNPYLTLKHNNGSPPLFSIQSWDGTSARVFLEFDHANDRLNLSAGTIRWKGKDISEGAADSGGSGFKVLRVPN